MMMKMLNMQLAEPPQASPSQTLSFSFSDLCQQVSSVLFLPTNGFAPCYLFHSQHTIHFLSRFAAWHSAATFCVACSLAQRFIISAYKKISFRRICVFLKFGRIVYRSFSKQNFKQGTTFHGSMAPSCKVLLTIKQPTK